jgi:Zn-finger nucleic acid-binding protein
MQTECIEPGLSVHRCPKSGGVWIPLQSFLEWRESQPACPVAAPAGPVPRLADDALRPVLICPESGRLLSRFKVGRGLAFHVDRSPATGGMWLDAGEWETLKIHGIHGELNMVFTAAYQHQQRSEAYRQSLRTAFRERIGARDFGRVEEFKAWLEGHPKRRDILRHLSEAEG